MPIGSPSSIPESAFDITSQRQDDHHDGVWRARHGARSGARRLHAVGDLRGAGEQQSPIAAACFSAWSWSLAVVFMPRGADRSDAPVPPNRLALFPRRKSASAPAMSAPLFEVHGLVTRASTAWSRSATSASPSSTDEFMGLIGPNGAGKSTLVNLIGGTLRLDAGEIYFDGARIDRLPPTARAHLGIGRTYQICKPFPGLSVLDNVAMGALFGARRGRERPAQGARESAAPSGSISSVSAEQAAQRADGARRPRPQAARIRQGAGDAAQAVAAATR